MIIKNAEVYTENGIFEKKDIYISGGKFLEKPAESEQEIVTRKLWTGQVAMRFRD